MTWLKWHHRIARCEYIWKTPQNSFYDSITYLYHSMGFFHNCIICNIMLIKSPRIRTYTETAPKLMSAKALWYYDFNP